MTRSNQDKWANFLLNERLDPAALAAADVLDLMELCRVLGGEGPPYPNGMGHPERLRARAVLVARAMDLGLDLSGITVRGRVAMGRGLLDAWVDEYRRRFGTAAGTAAEAERVRRNVKGGRR